MNWLMMAGHSYRYKCLRDALHKLVQQLKTTVQGATQMTLYKPHHSLSGTPPLSTKRGSQSKAHPSSSHSCTRGHLVAKDKAPQHLSLPKGLQIITFLRYVGLMIMFHQECFTQQPRALSLWYHIRLLRLRIRTLVLKGTQ